MTFAQAFRAHVAPRLERLCALQGVYVSMGIVGFDEAYNVVMDLARRLGALHLSSQDLLALEDWIATRILHHHDAHEALAAPIRQRIAKHHAEHMRAMEKVRELEFETWLTTATRQRGLNHHPHQRKITGTLSRSLSERQPQMTA